MTCIVNSRSEPPRRSGGFRAARGALAGLATLAALLVAGPAADASPTSFRLLDALEIGVFNIGPGQGRVKSVFDELIQKDVLQLEYTVPRGSLIGVWSKSFPRGLKAGAVDAVRIRIRLPDPDDLRRVALKVEIKGRNAVQTLPLQLEAGWNTIHEAIDWNRIGELREVVLVVKPVGRLTAGGEPANGTVDLDLEFYRLTFLQKRLILVNVSVVGMLSGLLALLAAWLGLLWGSRRRLTRRAPLQRDVLYGVAALLGTVAATTLYALGMVSPLHAGISLTCLAVGALGVVIAALLKWGLTGAQLTPGEVFQDALLSGLLAAGASRQELLQAPSSWADLVTINHLTAVLVFVTYHLVNARSLASSGKHVRPITAALIVGTPYLCGWLLVLESASLLQTLSRGLTGGLLAAWPVAAELAGRLVVVVGFNEALTNSISLAMRGSWLKTVKAHLLTLGVSSAVVASPLIAHLGSNAWAGSLPVATRALAAVATTVLAHAGLWGEVYLITGMILDALRHRAPSWETLSQHTRTGMGKGMAYSGLFMGMLYALQIALQLPGSRAILTGAPLPMGLLAGALLFPFLKTIIETFDGSQPFFDRVRYGYRQMTLMARGAVAGVGFAYAMTHGFFQQRMADRMLLGALVGLVASGGVSVLRDAAYALRRQGRIQPWRLYLVDALLGGCIGGAAGFYLDAAQVPVVVEKFQLYTSAGLPSADYLTFPLVSKWGRIDLGHYTGGVSLLFLEALAGVINWSVAAWLFAINRVIMEACFKKDRSPIRFFFSKAGFIELIQHMLYVLRWGLWMSPIIFTFLRMMAVPTWYNQDGAIRTLVAIYHHLTMSPEQFQQWSLQVFVAVLAVDLFRILIWMDHMGLRVATLVNLSFIGLDKLDERIARWVGPAAAQRYLPEAAKRFATWCPLLIPFYLPRGEAWDAAWSAAEAMQPPAGSVGLLGFLRSLTIPQTLLLLGAGLLVGVGASSGIRSLARRASRRRPRRYELRNHSYTVTLNETGEAYSTVVATEHDVSRRAYDLIDPCGRILYVVDQAQAPESPARSWAVVGNFPAQRFAPSRIERQDDALTIVNTAHGVRTTIEIRLPDQDSAAELWTLTLENLTEAPRQLTVVPYLEWVLTRAVDDRFHTQYARLFSEMAYVSEANAIFAWQRSTKALGFLAVEAAPAGMLTSRVEFIGRARSIWNPRILETLRFRPARETAAYPTFDPIGSLLVPMPLDPHACRTIRLMIGCVATRAAALTLIQRYLRPKPALPSGPSELTSAAPLIGHGEIPPGTPQPYTTYGDHGSTLVVHTPYTPRPFDHAVANALGHSILVTNRGLHTSSNGNSQQNRLTPDWSDTVTQEVPGEAIYLYDPDRRAWYAPTYHPLNDDRATHEAVFGVDGTATFRMSRDALSTELTVFVPPEAPVGVYLLTVRNHEDQPRRLRLAPYFQIVLAFQPEHSGPLGARADTALNALFFDNPRNAFRSGSAFAAMSLPAERMETRRGRFFGRDRGVAHPFLVEQGAPDLAQVTDERPIASFLTTLSIPAHGEQTVVLLLGQTDTREQAVQVIQRYRSVEAARESLAHTRDWWLRVMGTVQVQTTDREFDQLLDWLKYQAIAERLWARRGFYQTSGAFGFRDQLQDAVNLIWVDHTLARRQILLHAAHQFIEGDVFHWFFTLPDGRTAFACRSHASDNPLWLVWAVVEYVRATGDESILEEMTSYMISENPFQPLPKNKQGWGGLYHRSTRADSVYRHCLKSLDLVLERRMGAHGLPLIGTGDWNDGLDEIGSQGKGESIWLGFFLYAILTDMVELIGAREGPARREQYRKKQQELKAALELTWRRDRYLRAFHDDGTEIGVKDSGVWEIDALTAAWAVIAGVNPKRGFTAFHTALGALEREDTVLLGWPPLREDTTPYLGRSSKYPEGVRENGMYCHGVQWLIKAARMLAEQCDAAGDAALAKEHREIAYRLWRKITPIAHVTPPTWEIYGGQPNKQPADLLTAFDPGRMIWNGYTGAAGWLFREALEGVVGASLLRNELLLPTDLDQPRGALRVCSVRRDVGSSPLRRL